MGIFASKRTSRKANIVFVHGFWADGSVYWLLGSSVQKQARPDGERSSFPACKHRRVGVVSDVVDSILMLEQRYFHMMEKLLLWLVFLPLSGG